MLGQTNLILYLDLKFYTYGYFHAAIDLIIWLRAPYSNVL